MPGKVISITDDDAAVLEGMTLLLERAGYLIRAQRSAKPLLSGDAPIPDLFLIDKQLAGIDGLDACRALKAAPRTAHVPVIIVSAAPHVAALAMAAHADGFLEKPFTSAALLELIRSCLESVPEK